MAARIWLGTAGWSYVSDWNGPFYPPGTSSSDALYRYVEAFPFVEIDSTFYAAPAWTTVQRWGSIFPMESRVSCKAPRELVQDTGLTPPEVPFGHFCSMMHDHLGDRLARVVVQMQPSFGRTLENDISLRSFVTKWAPRVPLALELRSNSWMHESVDGFLAEHGVPRVSNDLHDVPDLERNCYNTSKTDAYIRLIGKHDGIAKDHIQRPQTDALVWWADQVDALSSDGVKNIYIVVNNHYEGHAPETLRKFGATLQQRGLDVVAFQGFPNGQARLF
jgi:uncharacterized protein YecE (DUF72 family)